MGKKPRPRALGKKGQPNRVVFQGGVRIGFADAEDDTDYLHECYVDIDQVQQVLNTEDPGSILLGRTGCGKTAAIMHIVSVQDNVIQIEPETLSLNFISNSNILSFFHGLGVNLDLFFQLLWRHVLCVELLNYHYNVKGKKKNFESILEYLKDTIGSNKSKRLALDYLKVWGTKFWEETQYRIREIVEKFENELQAGVNLANLGVPLNAHGSATVSGEQKTELINQAKSVISKVQIKELSDLMDVIAEDIFKDKQEKYYIVIDKLDENWVDDNLRYRLIRALIETIKSFRKVRNVKLIIALRIDLIERIYKYTKSGGFQEEKYEDFNVPINWSKENLFQLVDRRIGELYKRKYTKTNVHLYDVFPKKYRKEGATFDYLIERTQHRPRDIIAFINQILIVVAGKTTINANDIKKAEVEYSKKRLQALCTEWQEEHPCLEIYIESLRGMPSRIDVNDLSEETLTNTILSLCDKGEAPDGIPQIAREYLDNAASFDTLRAEIIRVLYKVGVLGIKLNKSEQMHFIFESSHVTAKEQIQPGVRLSIVPMLWQVLGNSKVSSTN